MKIKLIAGGIILVLINSAALMIWNISFRRRETGPFKRMGKYNVLWFALLGLVFGLSFIIVGVFGE